MRPRQPSPSELDPLQRAIVLTLLYSDLFDYPLTEVELRRYLPVPGPQRQVLDRAVAPLLGDWVTRTDDWLSLAGRESIVELRRERQSQGARLWGWAERYAGWMARVPFVRMVGVCGSLAAGNASADADVDMFLVTAPRRLWTVQVWAMTLRRLASCVGVRVCPNYFLTLDSLQVEPHTLYTAREVAQVVPLRGVETYARFLASNPWVHRLLPNTAGDADRGQVAPAPRPRVTRGVEWVLAGRVGDWLDRVLYQMLLLYYPRRRAREGWRRAHLIRAYRPDRQTVVGGGYGPAIERAFRQRVTDWFDSAALVPELDVLFPSRPAGRDQALVDAGADEEPGLYQELFAERYGRDDE